LEWKEAVWDRYVTSDRLRSPATTTHAIRAAIQRSQVSLATLSRERGIDPKTVEKWRKKTTVEDSKTGRKAPHSTILSEA
jgi:transposase-like protein